MLGCVVDHVASLAERGEVARPVVSRVMVQVSAGQHDAGHTWTWWVYARQYELDGQKIGQGCQSSDTPALSIAPSRAVLVPPSSVTQVDDLSTMRSLAVFATPLRPAKADQVRQLGPVDRIKPAVFRRDRHDDSMSQPTAERKQKVGSCAYFSFACSRRLSVEPDDAALSSVAQSSGGSPLSSMPLNTA